MSLFRLRAAVVPVVALFLIIPVIGGSPAACLAEAQGEGLDREVRLRLEYLASSGLAESMLLGTRPIASSEVARLIEEARDKIRLEAEWALASGNSASYGRADAYLEGFARESARRAGAEQNLYLKPVGSPMLSYIFLEGPSSPIPGTNAESHALVYNNGGVEPEESSNGYMEFTAEGALGPISMSVRPLVRVNDGWDGKVQEGFLRLRVGGLDMEAGKRGLWWGQGYHGGLILTENAEPMPMVRLTNPSPVLLPWVFQHLGPFKFDFFVARLEEERDVPKPYFMGTRLNFKPHPVVELGFTRTIIMGGRGRPGITPKRLGKIFFGDNIERSEDLSNSIAGMDARITLPWVQIYGEVGGEDEAGGLPFEFAYLGGIYLAIPGTGVDFRVEYADITNVLWYRHSLYSSGYTYKGRIMGHHAGRGARDLFAEVGVTGSMLKARLKADYEERGVTTQPVTERHYQAGFEVEGRLGRLFSEWRVGVEFGYDHVLNAGYTDGMEREDFMLAVAIEGVN